jgi:hypothetical protein
VYRHGAAQLEVTNRYGSYQILNTPTNVLYTVSARGECTQSLANGPADPTQLPFSLMIIDANAHMDGTGDSHDPAVASTKYYHDRNSYNANGVIVPAEQMFWYILPSQSSASAADQMVETVCQQTYGVTPNDGGTYTLQSGNRDFLSNMMLMQADATTCTIDKGTECAVQQQQEVQGQDAKGGSSAFGPVFF